MAYTQNISETQLAKGAYRWLRFSPILTVITYFILSAFNFGERFCNLVYCGYYKTDFYITAIIAILGSALWHLTLLQYVNNKKSEIVSWHGRQALVIAGLRTLIPISFLILDFILEAESIFYCLVIPVLILVWAIATPWGNKQVEHWECSLANWMGKIITPNTEDAQPTPQEITLTPNQPTNTEGNMADSESRKPEEVLKEILEALQSADDVNRLNAIAQLRGLNYGSEAIRNELEKLALHDSNPDVRKDALAALDLPPQRHVRNRINKIEGVNRHLLMQEITDWVKLGLLDKGIADVIRKRYDFDFTPAPAPKPLDQTPEQPASAQEAQSTLRPITPTAPRPTLTQTLLSETSIKIALYLGAFFVVASAAILAALSPAARLPVLIIASIIFGGLSLAIRKRLPQPSFALFIVFSFLLPITANVLEEALKLSPIISGVYWVILFLMMALIWGGSTWLYESRVFSVTTFIAFTIALYRMGDVFEAEPEFYAAATGFAALTGLLGVWILKKWKDAKFSLPLFLTTQILQAIILGASLIIFGAQFFDMPTTSPLWNIASTFTWAFAFLFYVISDLLFPFIIFPWFAALTLLPIPWFPALAFKMKGTGITILFFIWGTMLSIASEITHRIEVTRKFSLATLLVAILTFALALTAGFIEKVSLGFAIALGITCIYTALHILRTRGWLWALALLSFIVAYFSFFSLPLIEKADIYFGYQLLGLSILFLLPGLFFKNDTSINHAWRLPPIIYGALFTFITSLSFITKENPQYSAIGFGVFALFFLMYTAVQRKAIYGYLPAAYLPLAIFFTLSHFNIDAWLPALTGLAVLYYIAGIVIRSKETWSFTLRNSALVLGTIISFSALFTFKETGGWYALVVGLLFAAEMYLSKDGWFEIGIPIMFNIGVFLTLRDFKITESAYHLLAYSIVWLGTDLMAHFTFTHPRPLKFPVRIIGAALAIVNYGYLFFSADSKTAAIGFGIYTLLFLTISLLYRQPNLFYAFTLTLPLFVTFIFHSFEITKWIHPVIFVAMAYYAAGFFLRLIKRAKSWDSTLLFSGLGVGIIVSVAAPIIGGIDAALPVAFAATLWAVEAFARKNVWLGFPANGLYLLAYFIILGELKVDQPQFYSMGAALLGMLQHYLLTRAESKIGAFLMGMVSQLTLLGTTYIQMINTEQLIYFVVLFLQSLVVLVYGLVIRSRSLTFTPIALVVLGVITVLYTALKGLNTVVLIGCTGIILLTLGILAVVMREKITKVSEKLSDWKT